MERRKDIGTFLQDDQRCNSSTAYSIESIWIWGKRDSLSLKGSDPSIHRISKNTRRLEHLRLWAWVSWMRTRPISLPTQRRAQGPSSSPVLVSEVPSASQGALHPFCRQFECLDTFAVQSSIPTRKPSAQRNPKLGRCKCRFDYDVSMLLERSRTNNVRKMSPHGWTRLDMAQSPFLPICAGPPS